MILTPLIDIRKMGNVLLLMDYAAPYEGNFIPSIRNLEEHLNQTGRRLIYMFPVNAKNLVWFQKLEKEGKTIYSIENSIFSKKVKYSNIRKLKRIIKTENIGIIHTHFVAYNYTLALMKKLIIPHVKIAGNFMNEFHPPMNKFRHFKIFITKSTFDLIIGCSAAVAKSLTNTGIPEHKVRHVNNALDTLHLIDYEKIQIAGNVNQKIILMFGWTFYRKGVDIAIEAVKQLNAADEKYLLAIALPGPPSLIENEIISRLGAIPDWIKFLSPRNNAASYYNAADVFLSASREEGLAYSVLEAAYCNCMVIMSAIGGHAQDIPDTGVYDVNNTEQLKNIIKEMCDLTDQKKQEINQIQKEYVTRVYDLNKWSADIIKLYSTIR